jgi:hypothetical protein
MKNPDRADADLPFHTGQARKSAPYEGATKLATRFVKITSEIYRQGQCDLKINILK